MNGGHSAARAFLLTAPIAVGAWMGCLVAYSNLAYGPGPTAVTVPYILVAGVLFALPAVAALLAGIALPAFLLLRRIGAVTLPAALTVGAAAGLVAAALVAREFGTPETAFLPVPVALGAGLLSAFGWWRMWSERKDAAQAGAAE